MPEARRKSHLDLLVPVAGRGTAAPSLRSRAGPALAKLALCGAWLIMRPRRLMITLINLTIQLRDSAHCPQGGV